MKKKSGEKVRDKKKEKNTGKTRKKYKINTQNILKQEGSHQPYIDILCRYFVIYMMYIIKIWIYIGHCIYDI